MRHRRPRRPSAPRLLSLSAIVASTPGGVAQLVERLHGMQEVREFDSPRLHQSDQLFCLLGEPLDEYKMAWGDIWGDMLNRPLSVGRTRRPKVCFS